MKNATSGAAKAVLSVAAVAWLGAGVLGTAYAAAEVVAEQCETESGITTYCECSTWDCNKNHNEAIIDDMLG